MMVIKRILPEIAFLSSYPPRECGIATYSQDLIKVLNNKFIHSFKISICALESDQEKHDYAGENKYILNTDQSSDFVRLAKKINTNIAVKMVLIQHEFSFFDKNEAGFRQFLNTVSKPIIIVFHTVLPNPTETLKLKVQEIAYLSEAVVVMTQSSAKILIEDYGVLSEKITVIPHGTHLVPHSDKILLKEKYNVKGRKVLSTFGLLNSGKSIETTLHALPTIVKKNPNVLFLIIGKTHPSVIKKEQEKYREMLKAKIADLDLERHVRFINQFLPLPDLLEYLQLTDIYLFTSKDPNQAVSGTFSYAMSCGCPIVSTPIPHAREVLGNDTGIIIDFENSQQLAAAVNSLLENETLRQNISENGIHKIASTAWENTAIAHALLFEKIAAGQIVIEYKTPSINLDHLKRLTTHFGMIQFSIINQPDISTGYTLDDNARAMVAMCQHYELTQNPADIEYIAIYLHFIQFCFQANGHFLNYVNQQQIFTSQNDHTNLEDSNGRAIWSLGYLISLGNLLPYTLTQKAEILLEKALINIRKSHSTRAMAFAIKGLYYRNINNNTQHNLLLIRDLANRLVQMYRHEATKDWAWFESYLTYGNSILPEAMLCAWLAINKPSDRDPIYKNIAKTSFDFLLSKIFEKNRITVISNKGWLHKGEDQHEVTVGGEQPIDVAYTILALQKFYDVFEDEEYKHKMKTAFTWFLGNNHLHQIVYNPCTGGCYDGLEHSHMNLNQGAESTVSYLMARLVMAKSAMTHLLPSTTRLSKPTLTPPELLNLI